MFTPDGTFMTPELKFVPAITCVPMVVKSLLMCVPDQILFVYPCEMIHPRIIKCQALTSGTMVGSDNAENLWNQSKYLSTFTNDSVVRAKHAFETAQREGHVAVFSNVMNIILILNEEGTHIMQQMNILQHIEVTDSRSKQVYLE
jgi:hypothetical protein